MSQAKMVKLAQADLSYDSQDGRVYRFKADLAYDPALRGEELVHLCAQYWAKLMFLYASGHPDDAQTGSILNGMLHEMAEDPPERTASLFSLLQIEDVVEMTPDPLSWKEGQIQVVFFWLTSELRHLESYFSELVTQQALVYSGAVLIQEVRSRINAEADLRLWRAFAELSRYYASSGRAGDVQSITLGPAKAMRATRRSHSG